ncbi:MAG: sigma D regulator [Methylohalobius sp.]|nr:sigma D regulator [Methylohalobius sp.]
MTETPYSGIERRRHTDRMVYELLQERKQMWALYWEVAKLKPFDQNQAALRETLARFCQLMIDYISLGHFGIYHRIVSGTERRQRVIHAAQALYPEIAQATEIALKFNDLYENQNLSDPAVLARELSKLGEALAKRIELEDRLIETLSK